MRGGGRGVVTTFGESSLSGSRYYFGGGGGAFVTFGRSLLSSLLGIFTFGFQNLFINVKKCTVLSFQ